MTPGTGCRGGSAVMNGIVSPPNTVCTDWANGAAAGGLAAYTSGAGHIAPEHLPAERRIVGGFAVALANAANLLATQEYFAFNLLVNNALTVGTPSCTGCTQPACIVLNSINVATSDIGAHEYLTPGTFAGSNFATWQGVGPSCALVPTEDHLGPGEVPLPLTCHRPPTRTAPVGS